MALLITKREAALVGTNQAKTIVRAHRKVHYQKGAKVPLVLDRTGPSPFAIQIIGFVEADLSSINDARAKEAGFKSEAEFRQHWTHKLYGPQGIDPKAGADKKRSDAKVVVYRFRRADFVQRRLKVGP